MFFVCEALAKELISKQSQPTRWAHQLAYSGEGMEPAARMLILLLNVAFTSLLSMACGCTLKPPCLHSLAVRPGHFLPLRSDDDHSYQILKAHCLYSSTSLPAMPLLPKAQKIPVMPLLEGMWQVSGPEILLCGIVSPFSLTTSPLRWRSLAS